LTLHHPGLTPGHYRPISCYSIFKVSNMAGLLQVVSISLFVLFFCLLTFHRIAVKIQFVGQIVSLPKWRQANSLSYHAKALFSFSLLSRSKYHVLSCHYLILQPDTVCVKNIACFIFLSWLKLSYLYCTIVFRQCLLKSC